MDQKELMIMDTTYRDAHQSLLATREDTRYHERDPLHRMSCAAALLF